MKNPYFNLIRTVWRNGKPWHGSIVGYYIAYIIAQAFLSLSPYAFGRTIDVLQNFKPNQLVDVIFWLIVGVALVPLFWLFHGPARVLERNVAMKIQQAFRLSWYEKLTRLPLKWHQDHHSGNIITRLNRATTALHRFAEDQFIYIETIVRFVVSISFLLWISLPIGLLSFGACILAALTVLLFDRKLIPLYQSANEIDNRVGAVFFDYISNMTTVLTLRLGALTRTNLFQRLQLIWPCFKKEVVINEVKWFSMGMLLSAAQSIILIAYVIFALKLSGTILIGTVVMIFRYQWDLSEVFYNLSNHYSLLVKMDTDVKSLDPILEDIEDSTYIPQEEGLVDQWQHISIQGLTFQHPGEIVRGHIDQISFDLKRGEKVALIGSSGGGKSTLLNLLSGLYAPEKVQLTIDGLSFDSLEPVRSITTLIPQEPEIFENTMAFNITMDLEVAESELDEVIQLSGFAPVLATLSLGLATDVREKGLNLSVGQKQRLALARGLFAARFSSLILMDEPTSSVDLATEKTILSGILEKFSSTAMIVSLHRLHLLPKFDRIMMLDQGRLIAYGKTEELLSAPGPVRDLWQTYQA